MPQTSDSNGRWLRAAPWGMPVLLVPLLWWVAPAVHPEVQGLVLFGGLAVPRPLPPDRRYSSPVDA